MSSRYSKIIAKAIMLEAGGGFVIRPGDLHDYGIFDEPVGIGVAVVRLRVKMHQYAGARKARIRVRQSLDGESIEVYRKAKA